MVARLALLLLALPAAAQVRASQTVSATAGGFTGPLSDGDRFGVAAAPLGDLDGDGTPDLAVGAYGDREGRGAVWVLLLRPDGTVRQATAVRLPELAPGDFFGVALAALGDLDGDGAPELAVGADHADDGGPERGAVWIVSLEPDGRVRPAHAISATRGGLSDPLADGDLFGHSLATLGDLDGDGTPDLAVGADDTSDGGPRRGAVHVLFLRPDGTVRRSQRISDTAGGFAGGLDDQDFFGAAVAALGDLDGDGTPDLAASASRDDDGAADAGAVWVLFLRADGTVRAHQKISRTEGRFGGELAAGDGFGGTLVAPGDLDRDGTPDLLVGAGGDDRDGPDRGAGWVLSLRPDGTVRHHQRIGSATPAAGAFADGDAWMPIADLDDLDGDGAADWAWGARLADDGGPSRGAARILFTGYATPSAPSAPDSSLRLVVSPNPARGRLRLQVQAPPGAWLAVLDSRGRHVAQLDPTASEIDVSGWPAGVYWLHLGIAGARVARPAVVVR